MSIESDKKRTSSSANLQDRSGKRERESPIPIELILNSILNGGNSKTNSIKKRINESGMSDKLKSSMLKKLDNGTLDEKLKDWFESLLSIPFGKYTPLPIDVEKDNIEKYFTDLISNLNKSVHGLSDVKDEIINYMAQCITTKNPSPRVLGLYGTAGIGKTKIVRDGIAKALNRPLQTFSMGGIKDSQHFVGFDYSYAHSSYGSIVDAIINSGVMNPIIFFDELDKISTGSEGRDIENLLIHITDPLQNHDFKDKYFDGVSIDLSKAVFIFAFNDIESINPILRDRLHTVYIPPPTEVDKLIITRDYIIDELLKKIGLKSTDFKITDDAIMYIITNYSDRDSGIRSVKHCIETILLKVNTIKLLRKTSIKIYFSESLVTQGDTIVIDIDTVKRLLKNHINNRDIDRKLHSMYM